MPTSTRWKNKENFTQFMKEFHIECGVYGNEPKLQKKDHLFLPLFQAHETAECLWKPSRSSPFSIIFTSKNALKIFLNHILPHCNEPSQWELRESVAAVGSATAEMAECHLPQFLLAKCASVFFPKLRHGLESLLNEENVFSDLSEIVIFTSLNGKTNEIIKNFKNKKNFSFKIAPIYTLAPLNADFSSLFKKFNFENKREEISKCRIIFYCKSGYVLHHLVCLLMKYFKVSSPQKLPLFVYFNTWEKSAYDALCDLNLIDRKI